MNCGWRRLALCVALLATTALACAAEPPAWGARIDQDANHVFPKCAAVVDVTQPPYLAKGDGKTDDTQALQRALSDNMGQRKIIYLPNGTYRVTQALTYSKKNSQGQDAWGFTTLHGQNALKTILRLDDGVFTDTASPKAVLWCGGFGSADWFHNYLENFTINVGRGNPGAIGLQFYSNNTGAMRQIRIVSEDGQGAVGLDLAHRDMNGPLLVRNVEVRGFQIGVLAGNAVNSQTFEHVTLSDYHQVGLWNRGQSLSVRSLRCASPHVAVRNQGFMSLIDMKCIGRSKSSEGAIQFSGSNCFVRNASAKGARVIDAAILTGQATDDFVKEFSTGQATGPFRSKPNENAAVKSSPVKRENTSLGLPVRETPAAPWDDPATWAIVDAFGADPSGGSDSTDAIQKAIDSGATTVFFPGSYQITKPVTVRGKVRRLLGVGGWLDYNHVCKPDLILADGEADTLWIEHFAPINGGVEISTSRTIVLRSVETDLTIKNKPDLFLEDFCTHDLRIQPGQKVWARQLNVENEGTHITNAGDLWVLGYKTERGGTLLDAKPGSRSEIFGNLSYTTTAGKLAPMFVTDNAKVFAYFNEVCFSGDPFAKLIRETLGKQTRDIEPGQGNTMPYVSGN